MTRAILIDPNERTVKEIQLKESEGLREYYKYMDCDIVERIVFTAGDGQIVLDEEGAFKGGNKAFILKQTAAVYQAPFMGKAILTGYDFMDLPSKYTKELIQATILWL